MPALAAIALCASAMADEILPVLKINGQVYSNATVFKVTATDIYFASPQGMGNAKLKNLDADLQKHFHYNVTNAAAVQQRQTAANAQYLSVISGRTMPPSSQEIPMPSSGASASELNWGVDLPTAIGQARSQYKMVLLNFTGSDWCPWCVKFESEALSASKFADYAQRRLVLVELDFPAHKTQNDVLKRDNMELYQQFNVKGFPTLILLDSNGKELGRQVGYREGGPDAFIAELEGFAKK